MRLILTIFILFSWDLNAQNIQYQQGEIIVEYNNNPKYLSKILKKIGIKAVIEDLVEDIYLLKIKSAEYNTDQIINKVQQLPYVGHVQKNRLLQLRNTPNDNLFPRQSTLINSSIENAWNSATGGLTPQGDTIVIAVIDNGIDLDHEDLKDNLWVNRHEIPNNNIDDDNNGYIDDYYGWNSLDGSLNNKASHGTAVTGIIGAKGNNNLGVSGVNWNIKIMFIKGGGTEAAAIRAYSYPLKMRQLYNQTNGEKGAYIVATNSSWGIDNGKAEEAPLWCSFYDRMGAEGILSVTATSNTVMNVEQQGDLPSLCKSDYILTVTNIDQSDVLRGAYGQQSIDIAAYGQDAFTTQPNDRYGNFNGTSSATPHVTGTIGLIYAIDCHISDIKNLEDQARYVKDIILKSTTPIDYLKNRIVTGGKLNIERALAQAQKDCDINLLRPKIYPNPSEKLNIQGGEIESLKIFNIKGELIYSGHYSEYLQFDFTAGIYIVMVTEENGKTSTLKWIKI